MIRKALLAATVVSGLVVPATAGVYLPPKPAIIKPENVEFSKHLLLGMPLTMGMLKPSGGVAAPNILGTPTRGSSTTLSHTVVSGTKCLVVRMALSNENVSAVPTTCTWNGTSLVRGAFCYGNNNNNSANAVIFYLLNPTPATGSLSFSGAENRTLSCENWANVSGVGANTATTAGSALSSFSWAYTKTNTLNVLIAAAILRQGTAWTPGTSNTEEVDTGWTTPANHRAYFGRADTVSTLAASCAGGNNTFGACGLELVAGT